MKKLFYPVIFFSLFLFACKVHTEKGQAAVNSDSLEIRRQYSESPVISAENAIGMMKLESGFEIKLVASEPLVNSPVTLAFDGKGRIWVTEMQGYMPDTAGTGENQPTGKIVILEDTTGDGVMD
ncbi:MAG: dehydrogenase, partial [Chitinophagaceae bacterium]